MGTQRMTRWPLVAFCSLVVALGFGVHTISGAQPERDQKRELNEISQKLDAVARSQEAIMQKLDLLMQEVQIVKVRATR